MPQTDPLPPPLDLDTEAKVIAEAERAGLDPGRVCDLVSTLIQNKVLGPPPIGTLSEGAAARVALARLSRAVPYVDESEDDEAEVPE